jgi:hypothetical protein
MENIFQVAIHCNEDIGYIEYAIDTKTAKVVLHSQEKVAEVHAFLEAEHEFRVPHETLRDFTPEKIQPLSSLENFKLTLTRIWESTDVYVDWSRPVDYVIAHMDK